MTKQKDDKAPAIEEIQEEDMHTVSGGRDDLATPESQKRMKREYSLVIEGTDIGSGGLTAPKPKD